MNGLTLLTVLAAAGVLGTPALAQTTNTMSNSMSGSASGSMNNNAVDKGMHQGHQGHHTMAMHHAGHMNMSKCEHMCRMMMHHGKMSKHHSKTMKHDM